MKKRRNSDTAIRTLKRKALMGDIQAARGYLKETIRSPRTLFVLEKTREDNAEEFEPVAVFSSREDAELFGLHIIFPNLALSDQFDVESIARDGEAYYNKYWSAMAEALVTPGATLAHPAIKDHLEFTCRIVELPYLS